MPPTRYPPADGTNPLDDWESIYEGRLLRGTPDGPAWPGSRRPDLTGRQDRIYADMEVIQVVARGGISPLDLMERTTVSIEGFQACEIVEQQRSLRAGWNLPLEVGDAS